GDGLEPLPREPGDGLAATRLAQEPEHLARDLLVAAGELGLAAARDDVPARRPAAPRGAGGRRLVDADLAVLLQQREVPADGGRGEPQDGGERPGRDRTAGRDELEHATARRTVGLVARHVDRGYLSRCAHVVTSSPLPGRTPTRGPALAGVRAFENILVP